MICCKIIAKLGDNFSNVYNDLSKKGCILSENGNLYFYSLLEPVKENTIKNILRKNACTKYFIDVYARDNVPNESVYINGWLANGLMQISVIEYEKVNHDAMIKIRDGLEALNQQLDEELEKIRSKQ